MDSRTPTVDVALSRVFKRGIWATAFFYTVAVVLAYIRHRDIAGEAVYPESLADLFRGLVSLEPAIWAYVGTLALVATPIFAILRALRFFRRTHEVAFERIIYLVLAIFVLSLLAGLVFGVKVH